MNEMEKKSVRHYFMKKQMMVPWLMLFLMVTTLHTKVTGQDRGITEKNIVFIDYPDFPDGHSTWNDIGYNSKYNTVYVGVTNHKDKIAFYEYKATENTMALKGFLGDLAYLRPFQWQGKIHSKIIAGPDGAMYFSTDGGESREEYLMEHPKGYAGGYFMKWDPATDQLTNLGIGMQYESIKDVDVDPETGKLYGISYPQVHFMIYDPKTNDLQDLGRLGSTHVPRVMFTDKWGNCYYVDWRQRLVKFDKGLNKLVFAKESLPAFSGTPGSKIVTGITAFAKDEKNQVIYLLTYGAKVLAFYPQKDGIGRVEDLGGVADTGKKEPWRPYVPNLNIGNNGKLYYVIGGHGNYIKDNTTVLMEFDPTTKKSRILFDFPISEISEATGGDTKDKDGNLYFLGRKDSKKGSVAGEEGTGSSAFLIKFNPEKEVQK
jgi:hypothetical protein